MEKIIAQVTLKDRDTLKLIERDGKILLCILGCEELRSRIEQIFQEQGPNIKTWVVTGKSHGDLLMKKMLFQLNQVKGPYPDEEVCHCRSVSLETIEQSLFNGAHSVQAIRRTTTANTACGSCQGDVEAILAHWLGRESHLK
jgi:NAD(P)H-nitrite reductase large subunit